LIGEGSLGAETEGGEEVEVLFDGRVRGGEEFVAVENGVRTGEEAEGLGFIGEAGAAGTETDFGFGEKQPGDGDHPDEVEGLDGVLGGEGGAGHWHEGVDRDAFGRGIELGEREEHFQAVIDGFSKAEDTAAADCHPGALDCAEGVEAILEGVGGDDLRIIVFRGIDVVIVGGDAGGFELAGFGVAELTEGDADFHAKGADLADGFEDLFEAGITGADPFPCGTHAETGGTGGACGFGAFEDGFAGEETFGSDTGLVAGTLGAVATIFAAATGFDTEKAAELDFIGRPMVLGDRAGLLQEIEEGAVIEGLKVGEVHECNSGRVE